MRLDLGGGAIPLEGFVNLDAVHGDGPWRRLVQDVPWPLGDGEASEIYSSHMLEHVPAGRARIDVFNEAHRVLRSGGTFTIRVPLFPTWQAIADPTHVSFFVPESFRYFTGELRADADYGIRLWRMMSCDTGAAEIMAVLAKP